MAYIWVKENNKVVASVPLTGELRIGRGHDCEIALMDRRASRLHALIRVTGVTFELEDLGSTNGTFVNGARVEGRCLVKTGDTIAIGESNLLVRAEPYFDAGSSPVEDITSDELRTLAFDRAEAAIISPKDRDAAYKRLVALYKLASAAGSARTVGALFQIIVSAAEEVLESDRVYAVLNEKGEFRPWRKGGGKRGALADDIQKIPISQSIVRNAAEELRPVLMARRKGEKYRNRESVLKLEIATALAVPLSVGKELLAVLYADRIGGAPEFTDEDAEWIAAVAQIASGPLFALRNQERLSSRVSSLEKMLSGEIEMVGDSSELDTVRVLTKQAAATDSPILITGESGVGKELVVRLLHLNSPRSDRPLEVLNCAALPETLAESELFGHVKGAFTGAFDEKPGRFHIADGGTLLLDEIGELPLALQVKLLRTIETGEVRMVGGSETKIVDVRIVAATNRDLEKEVAEGRFRQDLFYRLDVIRIHVPPLRERRGDIPLLVKHYLAYFAGTMGRAVPQLSPEALLLFSDYPWPGNVRELKNAVERLMVLFPKDSLNDEDVRGVLKVGAAPAPASYLPLAEMEKRHILNVLDSCGGNKTKAADVLGLNRTTLYNKLQEFGIKD